MLNIETLFSYKIKLLSFKNDALCLFTFVVLPMRPALVVCTAVQEE